MRKINEGKLAIIMVLALIAFVTGSAVGITVSISEHEVVNNTTDNNDNIHVENVTTEMLNKSKVNETPYYEENYSANFTNESLGQNGSNLQGYDPYLEQQYEYV